MLWRRCEEVHTRGIYPWCIARFSAYCRRFNRYECHLPDLYSVIRPQPIHFFEYRRIDIILQDDTGQCIAWLDVVDVD